MSLVLNYAARSDRGLVRGNNEDSVYAGPRLLALADGMGGHAAGEVASQLMITAMAPLDEDEPGSDLTGLLAEAVRMGNSSIADSVERDPDLDGMGTTLTALLFGGTKLGLAHVGDSRAYLLRDGKLTQITRDDTFVQSLVDEGRITKEQAHVHPQRSLIMRALTGIEVEPTLVVREVRVGDRYLLCSDGLSDVVSEETIAATMRTGSHEECADRLIELALRGGGPDNVTVVVADVLELDYGQTDPIVGGAASGEVEALTHPNTAAGRAAAIAQPVTESRRILPTEVPAKPKRSYKKVLILGAIAAVIAIIAGLGVGYWVWGNYFFAERTSTDEIAIKQGWKISGLNRTLAYVCLEGDKVTFAAEDETCDRLHIDDLAPTARSSFGSYKGSQSEIEDQLAKALTLLPPCEPARAADAAPGPGPAAEPSPAVPPPGNTGPVDTQSESIQPREQTEQNATGQSATPQSPAPETTTTPVVPAQQKNTDCRQTK